MAEPIDWDPRGVLHSQSIQGPCEVWRFAPCEALANTLEHLWAVSWDLRDREPIVRETLPHPSVHVVIEDGRSGISGVATQRFTRTLEGEGWVLGLKFQPGCFQPFSPLPMDELTDRVIPLHKVFGEAGDQLEHSILACTSDVQRAADLGEAFLLERLPRPDPEAQAVRGIVRLILEDPELKRAQDVADRAGLGLRSLQRLFKRYVGVSPKWVIQRYRLHEALAQLDAGATLDLGALAQELGFFDQAHFTRHFKALVGRTPGEYVSSQE